MALLLTVATGAWAQDPDPIDLTPSADGTVWTLSTMPEYDVELEVTYYTDAELDQMAADEVIAKITAIGTVTYTPESKALIDAARTAYDALTATQQALVTNYSTLTDAETTYATAEETAYTEGVELTKNPDGTWTLAATPAFDVELEVEYYDELMDGDEDDNTALLASLNGKTTDIYLDRTLEKEKWYTLCLPFAVDLTTDGPLKGVTAKTLSSVVIAGSTVTLTFGEAVTSLAAGTPYIVKLPEGATENLIDPLFEGATISNELHNVAVTGGTFKGTYARVDWNAPNTKVLFLQNNEFLYPDPSAHVNAFRAYIELEKDVPVSAGAKIILDFGDDNASGIETVETDAQQDGIWYTLQGIPLDSKPTEKGIYILNGRKVAIQ